MKSLFFSLLLTFFILQNTMGQTYVKISTDMGDMKVMLYDETPLHRDNFVKLIKDGFYDNLLFHRVIKDFMIQGGDPQSRNAGAQERLGNGGPGYTVPAELRAEFIHKKGALAAARLSDQANPMRASSGSQFYIVQGKPINEQELGMFENRLGFTYTDKQRQEYIKLGGTPFLDRSYTVFGEVVEGLDIIDKIAATPTGYGDRPKQDVKMTITVLK